MTFRWKNALALSVLLVGVYFLTLQAGPHSDDHSGDLQPAPDFDVQLASGEAAVLASFKGRVLLLDFWSETCPPCLAELPHLRALHGALGEQGLSILGVSVDGPRLADLRRFSAENGIAYLLAVPGAGGLDGYPVYGLPSAFLIDRSGMLVKTYFGYKDPIELEGDIRRLLSASGMPRSMPG